MLNEKRVKHMVRLALYESGDGKEEIQIHTKPKKEYVNKNIIYSIVWMTIAYLIIAIFIYRLLCEHIFGELSTMQSFFLLATMALIYFAMLILYAVRAGFHYEKKYKRAHRRVNAFSKALEDLEKMYVEEENHE